MRISLPPRPPGLGDPSPVDQEALIEEARRRTRRRRQRNFAGVLAAVLGALWLYSLLGGGGPGNGSALLSASSPGAAPLKALPEELSFSADGAIWLLRRDGSPTHLVDHVYATLPDGSLRSVRTIYGVEWSPDGSRLLAFRRGASPALVLVDGRGRIGPTIAPGASIGRWSPDGRHIAFVRRTPDAGNAIFVAARDGEDVTRVAGSAQHQAGSFSWSPDGSKIVYAGRRGTGLFVADASGRSVPRRIRMAPGGDFPDGNGVTEAQWSPGGTKIAFTSGGHVYVVRADGTGSRRIADGYGIAWSPDARLVAFLGLGVGVGVGVGVGDVFVVRSDGTALRRIAGCRCTLRGPGFWPSLSWSSDGSRIAYVSAQGNTVSTVRSDGSGATRVAAVAGPWWPIWRPSLRR